MVQNGLAHKLTVRKVEKKGWGASTLLHERSELLEILFA